MKDGVRFKYLREADDTFLECYFKEDIDFQGFDKEIREWIMEALDMLLILKSKIIDFQNLIFPTINKINKSTN